MMYAKKIKMETGNYYSNNIQEIDKIYVDGCSNPGYFEKESLYDYLKKNPGSIRVFISPFPEIVPALSSRGEKYVRSEPNDSIFDNLLRLPREQKGDSDMKVHHGGKVGAAART